MHPFASTRVPLCQTAVVLVICFSLLTPAVVAVTGTVEAQESPPTSTPTPTSAQDRPNTSTGSNDSTGTPESVVVDWENSTGTPSEAAPPGHWYDDNRGTSTPEENRSGGQIGDDSPEEGCSIIHFDTWGCYSSVVKTVLEDFTSGVSAFVDKFHEETLTLPAPGSLDDPMSWLYPENDKWPHIMPIYWALYSVVAIPMLAQGSWNIFASDPHERRPEARRWGKNLFLLVGGLVIVPLALHGGNVIAMGFSPQGEEFFATPGDAAKLGVGLTMGAILLWIKAILVAVAIIVVLVQDIMTYWAVAMYPAAIWLVSTRNTFAQAIGAGIIGMLSFLIFLKCAQAIFLRFLFEMPMGTDQAAASLMTIIQTIIGVVVAFVALPYYGTLKAIPASAVMITGKMRSEGEDWIEDSREKFPDREELVDRVHGTRGAMFNRATPARSGDATATATAHSTSDASVGGSDPARPVGSVQERVAGDSRPGSRTGDTHGGSGQRQSGRTTDVTDATDTAESNDYGSD